MLFSIGEELENADTEEFEVNPQASSSNSVQVPVKDVVDSTGAGDIFASGVIFGMSRKLPFKKCAEMGSRMASEVITSLGPRIEKDPKKIVERFL